MPVSIRAASCATARQCALLTKPGRRCCKSANNVRAVVQRVAEARVRVDDRVVGEIGSGLLVLLCVGREDGAEDVTYVAAKIRDMRIFEGEAGRHMERSVREVGGSVLIVSQFTLYGDIRKGRRPAFDAAAPTQVARTLYENVVR